MTTLPYVDEPRDLRLALNTPESLVKYPAIRTTPREAAADPASRLPDGWDTYGTVFGRFSSESRATNSTVSRSAPLAR